MIKTYVHDLNTGLVRCSDPHLVVKKCQTDFKELRYQITGNINFLVHYSGQGLRECSHMQAIFFYVATTNR